MNFLYVRRSVDWPSPVISRWNELFSMDWREFEFQMSKIALSNWKIPHILGTGQCDECGLPTYEIDGEDLLVPTSRHDWFSPRLDGVLSKVNPDVDFVRWNVLVNSTMNKSHSYVWNKKRVCSNGYAVRARVLTTELVDDAIAMKTGVNCVLNIVEIDEGLSCCNKFPGGSELLFQHDLSLLSKPYGSRTPLDGEFGWVASCIERLDVLLRKVAR